MVAPSRSPLPPHPPRTHGSAEDFDADWREALQSASERWLVYPSADDGTQTSLAEWVKALDVLAALDAGGIRGGTVLEYGCGAGGMSAFLARRGYDCIALDRSLAALEVARRNARRHDAPVHMVAGDVLALPLRPGACDVAMSYGLLEHFDAAASARLMHEVVEILRPGGLCIADIVPGRLNARTLGVAASFMASAALHLVTGRAARVPALRDSYFHHYYESAAGPDEWAGRLRRAGLADTSVRVCRPFPPLALSGPAERAYTRLQRRLLPGWRAFDRAGTAVTRAWGWMYLATGMKPASGVTTTRACLVERNEPARTGTSRYVERLTQSLPQTGVTPLVCSTNPTGALKRALRPARHVGLDAVRFWSQYPLHLRWPIADVYHLTSQTYASALLAAPPPAPAIVTIHDIIPYLMRRTARLKLYRHHVHRVVDSLAMHGLRRARHLLADSEWTAGTLVEALGIRPSRISVCPLGVDLERFRPDLPKGQLDDTRARLGLPEGQRFALAVGSEDPRKNLRALLAAFARIAPQQPDVWLVKAGTPHFDAEHQALLRLAERMGIAARVRWLDTVTEADLSALFALADVFVMPSLLEGFGLPVLEALASGTRVVAARAAALPEVAGADSVLCPPTADGLALALSTALAQPPRDPDATNARRQWASQFTWERTVRAVASAYVGA